jgi:hypothetical protein
MIGLFGDFPFAHLAPAGWAFFSITQLGKSGTGPAAP